MAEQEDEMVGEFETFACDCARYNHWVFGPSDEDDDFPPKIFDGLHASPRKSPGPSG